MESTDVLVVGAGLSGLACAVHLQRQGLRVQVVDAAPSVGGRVQTDEVDGFLLDRGFQVFLDAYPEGKRLLDYPALDLRAFLPGARVRYENRFHEVLDPARRLSAAWGTLTSPIGTVADKTRLALLRAQIVSDGATRLAGSQRDQSTAQYLDAQGFSDTVIERFFRPFYGGVFLEQGLASSADMFEFTFRMFATGNACVPARGMGDIPKQLAARLPAGSIMLNRAVVAIENGEAVDDSGHRFSARRTVLATDATQTAKLLGAPTQPMWRGTDCFYFACDAGVIGSGLSNAPILHLNAEGKGLINSAHVVTALSPEVAPRGKDLVSVTLKECAPGQADDAAAERERVSTVQQELSAWFGGEAAQYPLLRRHRIPRSLPGAASASPQTLPGFEQKSDRLWVCGDHLGGASIQGALYSGRMAAERLLAVRSAA